MSYTIFSKITFVQRLSADASKCEYRFYTQVKCNIVVTVYSILDVFQQIQFFGLIMPVGFDWNKFIHIYAELFINHVKDKQLDIYSMPLQYLTLHEHV